MILRFKDDSSIIIKRREDLSGWIRLRCVYGDGKFVKKNCTLRCPLLSEPVFNADSGKYEVTFCQDRILEFNGFEDGRKQNF